MIEFVIYFVFTFGQPGVDIEFNLVLNPPDPETYTEEL